MDAKTLPPNTVRAHILPGANIKTEDHIRPAKVKRDWMDEMPGAYGYRCIPLLAANTMGWELLNPSENSCSWDGGEQTTALTIEGERTRFGMGSHFGCGVITWYIPFLFRTSAELGLYITGPANHDKNGVTPLDAFVRTDWLPFPFTLNWRMMDKDRKVSFAAGEPIARIMPFPLAMLDETKLEIDMLNNDPGFAREVQAFGQARQANVAKQQENARRAALTGEEISADGVWNAQYVKARGKTEDGTGGMLPHQTIFKPGAPIDVTEDE